MPKEIPNGNLKCLEIKVAVLAEAHKKDIERIEEQTNLKFESQNKALLIETKEIARRLEILNGEAERLRSMQETYLPREVYETEHRELRKKVDGIEEYKNNALGRQAITTIAVSAIISLGFLILNYFLTGTR
jgi:hypothetical protein